VTESRPITGARSVSQDNGNLLSNLPSLRRMSKRDQRRLEMRLRSLALDVKAGGVTSVAAAASLLRASYELEARVSP